MSTKIVRTEPAVTEQTRPSVYDALSKLASSLTPIGTNITGVHEWGLADSTPRAAIHQESAKAIEARRQIDRVKSLVSLCVTDSEDDQERLESIATSVALIGTFFSSPLPIPVASSGSECGATLFFQDEDFYGDLEIRGNEVEYYIKTKEDNSSIEIYDQENVEDGMIPPRLLVHLFSFYAR